MQKILLLALLLWLASPAKPIKAQTSACDPAALFAELATLQASGNPKADLQLLREVQVKIAGVIRLCAEQSSNALADLPIAAADQGTAEKPVLLGQVGSTVYKGKTISLAITEIMRGEEARLAIEQANFFNEAPAQGMEYVMLYVVVSADSGNTGAPVALSFYDFSFIVDGQSVRAQSFLVEINGLDVVLEAGASDAGWVVTQVKIGAPLPLLTLADQLFFSPAANP
jgi:hypothetical protein